MFKLFYTSMLNPIN